MTGYGLLPGIDLNLSKVDPAKRELLKNLSPVRFTIMKGRLVKNEKRLPGVISLGDYVSGAGTLPGTREGFEFQVDEFVDLGRGPPGRRSFFKILVGDGRGLEYVSEDSFRARAWKKLDMAKASGGYRSIEIEDLIVESKTLTDAKVVIVGWVQHVNFMAPNNNLRIAAGTGGESPTLLIDVRSLSKTARNKLLRMRRWQDRIAILGVVRKGDLLHYRRTGFYVLADEVVILGWLDSGK